MHPSCSHSSVVAFVSNTLSGYDALEHLADGRTTVYIFVGSITMGDNWWKYTAGSIVVLIGIGYVVLEYTPSIEPPANMRYASQEAGAFETDG